MRPSYMNTLLQTSLQGCELPSHSRLNHQSLFNGPNTGLFAPGKDPHAPPPRHHPKQIVNFKDVAISGAPRTL